MKANVHIFILFLIVLTGCLSEKKIERRYYTLEMPADHLAIYHDSVLRIQGNCEIEQVVVNRIYEKNLIVNRIGSNEINYYVYNQWAIRPSDAVTALIHEYLETAGIFQYVSDRYGRSVPDYRFWTSVNNLEIIEKNKSSSAHLNLEFRLIDNSNEKIIVSHIADRISPLKRNDLNIFALEVSKIIREELDIFAGMIVDKMQLFSGNP